MMAVTEEYRRAKDSGDTEKLYQIRLASCPTRRSSFDTPLHGARQHHKNKGSHQWRRTSVPLPPQVYYRHLVVFCWDKTPRVQMWPYGYTACTGSGVSARARGVCDGARIIAPYSGCIGLYESQTSGPCCGDRCFNR